MDKVNSQNQTQHQRARIAVGGRLVIPADFRQQMGIHVGDEVLLRLDGDGLRVSTLDHAIRQVQSYFTSLKTGSESVVDELIRDRRAEAAREARELDD